MSKKTMLLLVIVLTVTAGLQTASGEGFPSAKATARCGDIAIIDAI